MVEEEEYRSICFTVKVSGSKDGGMEDLGKDTNINTSF